ncbi:MAG TPA: RagB/SusD family nutrient uptake outer membrane protein [Prolixibacteraceae bacterium]|nr:RagB/SusD family nutrient uptake outer membrane protein [Prolixibacteraceae bacterium]
MKYTNKIINRGMIILMVVLVTMSSCDEDKLLNETPLDFLTTSNLYRTPDDFELASLGLYEKARDNFYAGSVNENSILKGSGSDFSYNGENPAGTPFLSNYATQLLPTSSIPLYFWTRGYQIVQFANVLIAELEATPIEDEVWEGNEAQRAILLGEARFFRAFAYRMLVTIYGDVPYLDQPVKTVKTDFSRADEDLIYDLIESDFIFASQNLPGRGDESAPGRLTKATASHFLCETYIARNKFPEAIAAANDVIDGGYSLMQARFGTQLDNDDPLLGGGDVYYDLFRYGNQNLSENTEGIWVIQFQNDVDGGSKYDGERMWGNAYYRMGNDPDGKQAIVGDNPDASSNIYLSTFSRPVAWNRSTNYVAYDIWRSDWNNDIRNARHNMFRDWRYNNPDSPNWYGKKIDFVNDYPIGSRNLVRDTCQYIFPFPMKAASPGIHFTDPNRSGGGTNHVDQYAVRLAETYLLRAEAHLGNGEKELAAADINVVRNRAKATPVASGDVTLDYILDERARELYTEEWRLITLMRLNLLYDRTIMYLSNPVAAGGVGAGIQPYNNLFPIPQSEIDLNVNGELIQNEGY